MGAGLGCAAALRRRTCAGSAGTTAATATATTLTIGTCSSLRSRASLRLIGGCLYVATALVIAVEVFVVEVFSAIKNDGVLVSGLGRSLDWS